MGNLTSRTQGPEEDDDSSYNKRLCLEAAPSSPAWQCAHDLGKKRGVESKALRKQLALEEPAPCTSAEVSSPRKRQSLERQEEAEPQTPRDQEAAGTASSSTPILQPPSKCQQPPGGRPCSSKSRASSPCTSGVENGRKSH